MSCHRVGKYFNYFKNDAMWFISLVNDWSATVGNKNLLKRSWTKLSESSNQLNCRYFKTNCQI